MSSVSCSKCGDHLLSLHRLKLKLLFVTSTCWVGLLKTVLDFFWYWGYHFFWTRFNALLPGDTSQSLNGLLVLSSSWSLRDSQKNCPPLGCISRADDRSVTQSPHRAPCWTPVPCKTSALLFTARCAHEICAHHAGGGGLKLCSFPDAASLWHSICVRAPGSSGSTNGCQHHALQSHFSFSRAQGVCGPFVKLLPLLLTSHKVLHEDQY